MTDNIRYLSADGRDNKGRFTNSPNNKGRPFGAVGKANRELMAQVRSLGPDAVSKLTEALGKNQQWAVEFVLKYCLPKDGRTVEFNDMTVDDLMAAAKAGDISLGEFRIAIDAMAKVHDIQELEQLRERIDELERMLNGKTHP